ncbi:MAG: poly-beta-1,6-N-acetyl-D-glucosamine N-deacetylase PgaB [Gammaproteobacteria bacterium]|nr:poly-beta-1,6-N-acetyl-D-glucosamine N-deacetylase PgaB [Gammaproteobacteria bacterium]MCF6363989.1 poly-beta-1,6-N-acetyl-D-glucosamine N-deacetylase PgaB [Gammaproteobacteria bacterium]
MMTNFKKIPQCLLGRMRETLWFLLLLLVCVMPVSAELLVISYHETSHVLGRDKDSKAMTLETSELAAQFSWLKEHGYVSVDINDLLAAQKGERPLPEKAVLLSFDDGYRGMYEQVFPLLRAFDYRALIAVVGSWLETPANKPVMYGSEPVSRDYFLSWRQIREMVKSGHVEVASHSYDLHRGVLANPQGNVQPAAVSLLYDAKTGRYESDKQYRQRIHRDLRRNSDLIARRIGQRPRAMVWPYGAHNRVTIDIARDLGMPVTLSLADDKVDINNLGSVGRLLIGHGTTLADFVWQVNNHIKPQPDPVRVVHLDIDYVYDPDPKQQDENLSLLLDRIKALGVNTVYLQAYADPDGDGNADALYFPNRHLPMRADLFNRVAWQLRTRTGVQVYAWLPVLAFDLPAEHPLAKARVVASPPRKPGSEDYRRLSPFNQQAQRFVGDIYEDLARHAPFEGLIFHDDAYLSDHEDASEWALKIYRNNWKLPANVNAIRDDPDLLQRWTLRKTKALAQWTDALSERVRLYRPMIKTARNMYASVIMNPQSEAWFAQSLDVFLEHYDYVAVMAMPYMEQAEDPQAWLRTLVARVASKPGALNKTVFELQSVDWRKGVPVDGDVLADQMRLLLHSGARNFGYYPDDFIQGRPSLDAVRPVISLVPAPEEN